MSPLNITIYRKIVVLIIKTYRQPTLIAVLFDTKSKQHTIVNAYTSQKVPSIFASYSERGLEKPHTATQTKKQLFISQKTIFSLPTQLVVENLNSTLPEEIVQLLKTQKYHLIGNHSAVKRCRWLYESLVHNRPCYKQQFYGIKSHRCIQMTPTIAQCDLRCSFCWRIQSGDLPETRWDEMASPTWDDPETIIEECIKQQKRIISGYKANPKVNPNKLREATEPKHVAISLAGEPTFYPYLGELIERFSQRGFTTFLVSNGTKPETLTKLSKEPTQLYISLCAPDETTFKKTCRPQTPDAWEKLNLTLSLLSTFKCPTVLRLTLSRHLNLKSPELYAKLIEKANPTYVEPKAYMYVGFSRLRLEFENMPRHKEIQEFATKLAKETGYNILQEAPESRVVLLSRLKKPIKLTQN